ncbi:Uncharacterized protein TCM_033834 [Theobroma cacao]|uniref:Uncharacterized protein n=1 Tax=Theobroma cacao TaxID=3641 RepID=A0A061FIY8_THECC|nr:Uncharacterized protein TCM_033834 [Theobroma cacao]
MDDRPKLMKTTGEEGSNYHSEHKRHLAAKIMKQCLNSFRGVGGMKCCHIMDYHSFIMMLRGFIRLRLRLLQMARIIKAKQSSSFFGVIGHGKRVVVVVLWIKERMMRLRAHILTIQCTKYLMGKAKWGL